MFRSCWSVIIALVLGFAFSACEKASPTASTAATPTPTPALPALTSAATLGCGLPSKPDLHNTCPVLEPRYLEDVRAAVQYVMGTRPDLVQPDGKVLDHRAYTNAVVEKLRTQGYCAVDQLEEIAVKKTNDFNEQYNVWTSLGYTRQSYITTCFPAQF